MEVMGGRPKHNLHLALARVKVINMSFQLETAALGTADNFTDSGLQAHNYTTVKLKICANVLENTQ